MKVDSKPVSALAVVVAALLTAQAPEFTRLADHNRGDRTRELVFRPLSIVAADETDLLVLGDHHGAYLRRVHLGPGGFEVTPLVRHPRADSFGALLRADGEPVLAAPGLGTWATPAGGPPRRLSALGDGGVSHLVYPVEARRLLVDQQTWRAWVLDGDEVRALDVPEGTQNIWTGGEHAWAVDRSLGLWRLVEDTFVRVHQLPGRSARSGVATPGFTAVDTIDGEDRWLNLVGPEGPLVPPIALPDYPGLAPLGDVVFVVLPGSRVYVTDGGPLEPLPMQLEGVDGAQAWPERLYLMRSLPEGTRVEVFHPGELTPRYGSSDVDGTPRPAGPSDIVTRQDGLHIMPEGIGPLPIEGSVRLMAATAQSGLLWVVTTREDGSSALSAWSLETGALRHEAPLPLHDGDADPRVLFSSGGRMYYQDVDPRRRPAPTRASQVYSTDGQRVRLESSLEAYVAQRIDGRWLLAGRSEDGVGCVEALVDGALVEVWRDPTGARGEVVALAQTSSGVVGRLEHPAGAKWALAGPRVEALTRGLEGVVDLAVSEGRAFVLRRRTPSADFELARLDERGRLSRLDWEGDNPAFLASDRGWLHSLRGARRVVHFVGASGVRAVAETESSWRGALGVVGDALGIIEGGAGDAPATARLISADGAERRIMRPGGAWSFVAPSRQPYLVHRDGDRSRLWYVGAQEARAVSSLPPARVLGGFADTPAGLGLWAFSDEAGWALLETTPDETRGLGAAHPWVQSLAFLRGPAVLDDFVMVPLFDPEVGVEPHVGPYPAWTEASPEPGLTPADGLAPADGCGCRATATGGPGPVTLFLAVAVATRRRRARAR